MVCLPTFLQSVHHLLQGYLTSVMFFPPTLWRRKCSGLPCGCFFHLLLIITCSFLEETNQRNRDEFCVGYLFNGLNVRLFVSYTANTSSSLAPLLPLPRRYPQSQKARVTYSSCQPEVADGLLK